MNFQEFVGAAEIHLRMAGWLMHGHNGVWRKYKKAGDAETKPLPAAITDEIKTNNVLGPAVEAYLVYSGWRRTSSGVSSGWPTFRKGDKAKKLPDALLRQMLEDRGTMAVYAPAPTVKEVADLLSSSTRIKIGEPLPSASANTARARR